MARDYYEILGVARDATADQIRSAHRKLARKYHPDLNKAANAAAMFKETQDAYDVLSDTAKRAKYDRFGHVGEQQSNMGGGNAGGYGGVDADTLESIFGNFMGGGGRGRGKRARGPQPGEDLTSTIQVGFMTAALGGMHHIDLQGPAGAIVVDVRIPPGISSDGQLRVRGKGGAGELHNFRCVRARPAWSHCEHYLSADHRHRLGERRGPGVRDQIPRPLPCRGAP